VSNCGKLSINRRSTLADAPNSYSSLQNNNISVADISSAEFERVFRTNVFANVYLTRAAVPLRKSHTQYPIPPTKPKASTKPPPVPVPPGGSIVFTSSGIVAQPNPLTIDYGASKAAITHLTRSLARQLAPAGIRVNAVAPGLTLTPFLATQGVRSEHIPMLTANSPYGRILQPAEIAPLYVAVVDPLKTGVSGEIFTAAAGIPGP
jgi:NAD(P)-dependent dehydrogenase (short-subunit alcohol dehydrogenase family)